MGAATWVAIIVPVLGFLGTVATILASRKQDRATAGKTSAEALQVVQDATLNLLAPMREQAAQMREQIEHLEALDKKKERQIKELRDRVDIVEDDREILVEAISAHVEWEDSGRLDPPGAPRIAPKVRSILARVHAA